MFDLMNGPSITHPQLIGLFQKHEKDAANKTFAEPASRLKWKTAFRQAITEANTMKCWRLEMLLALEELVDPISKNPICPRGEIHNMLTSSIREATKEEAAAQQMLKLRLVSEPTVATA